MTPANHEREIARIIDRGSPSDALWNTPRGEAARRLAGIRPTVEIAAVLREHSAMVRLLERLTKRASSYEVVHVTEAAGALLTVISGEEE